MRDRYRGHSQGALVSALHKIFEAVDLSSLVLGEAGGSAGGGAASRPHRLLPRLRTEARVGFETTVTFESVDFKRPLTSESAERRLTP